MKKSLLMVSLAAMAFASCTNEESVEVNKGRPIEFRHEMTRAAETTGANLSAFNVTALIGANAYFENLGYTREEGKTDFTPSTVYYWPGDDSKLDFYAYAPTTLTGATVTINSTTKRIADFSPATTISSQQDVVTATASGQKSKNEGTGVTLKFGHILSQIEVQAKVGDSAYKFEVTGVRIAGPVGKGTYAFGSGWTPSTVSSDKADYTVEYTTPIELKAGAQTLMGVNNGNTGESDNAMLIPQQLTAWNQATDKQNSSAGAYIAVKVKITTKGTQMQVFPYSKTVDGENQTSEWVAVPVNTNWEAGKKYTYVLDFTNGAGYVAPTEEINPGEPIFGGEIQLKVSVNGWETETKETKVPN